MRELIPENLRKYIKWYDYFWLLIPIAGISAFALVVYSRSWPEREAEIERRRREL